MHTVEDELASLAGDQDVTGSLALVLGKEVLLDVVLLLAWNAARGKEVLVQRRGVLDLSAIRGKRLDAGRPSQIPELKGVENMPCQALRKFLQTIRKSSQLCPRNRVDFRRDYIDSSDNNDKFSIDKLGLM